MAAATASPANATATTRDWSETATRRTASWRDRQTRRGSDPAVPCLAHIGKYDVVERDRAHHPAGVEDRPVGPDQHRALPLDVTRLDRRLPGRQGRRVAARSGDPVMGLEQVV